MSRKVFTGVAAATLLTLASGGAFAFDPPAAATPAAPADTAATATAPVAAKPQPKKNSPDEVICKQQDNLGSRLGGKKVCMTRAEWSQQSQDAEDHYFNSTPHH